MDKNVIELQRQLRQGKITRREFLRSVALLGISLGVSEVLAACRGEPTEQPFSRFQPWRTDIDSKLATEPSATLVVPTFTPAAESATAAKNPTPGPKGNISWLCASCGVNLRTIEELKKHAAKEHGWRLPAINRIEKPTYSQFLVGQVTRFDERNTVFSRTRWDKAYQALVQAAAAKAPQDDWEALEGRALVAGAIYVDDAAGNDHPSYYGYSGHMKGSSGLYGWDDPVNPAQFPVTDPAWMSERVKQVARFYGADLAGICEVDPRWIYSHTFELATGNHARLEMPYKYAIVMGIEMEWKGIDRSPGLEASAATALAYSRMAELSASLAKYIRALGYAAIPCGNDTAQSIPLAIDAGLGELGRNGLLLTPEYGPRQRICKVFTDLPLQADQPIDFGIQSFCETCHICAKTCPARAIRNEERTTEITSISNRPGLLRWPVDVAKCYLFWQENGCDCSNCIAACPWALHTQRDWLEG